MPKDVRLICCKVEHLRWKLVIQTLTNEFAKQTMTSCYLFLVLSLFFTFSPDSSSFRKKNHNELWHFTFKTLTHKSNDAPQTRISCKYLTMQENVRLTNSFSCLLWHQFCQLFCIWFGRIDSTWWFYMMRARIYLKLRCMPKHDFRTIMQSSCCVMALFSERLMNIINVLNVFRKYEWILCTTAANWCIKNIEEILPCDIYECNGKLKINEATWK